MNWNTVICIELEIIILLLCLVKQMVISLEDLQQISAKALLIHS